MNKYQAANYLLEKYESLIYEYSKEDLSYCLNACVCEAYSNIGFVGGQLFE